MDVSRQILELGAVLLAAAAMGWVARRLTLPAVLGYLVVGIAVSPFTPGYVADRGQIELLAEFGVVLLLFEVGIEVNLGRVRREQRRLLVAAPLQVLLSTSVGAALFVAAGLPVATSLVLGLAVSLSSSVVVVNIVRSRRRRTSAGTEQAMLTWSVLQDVVGVLLAAVLLSVAGAAGGRSPLSALLGLAGYLAVAVLAARLLPLALRRLGAEPDLFLIVAIGLGLALAGLGAAVFGVPAALAAFIAGLVVAESPEALTARRQLVPFRDVFAVLFFVSVGTLIDPGEVVAGVRWLVLIVVALLIGKVAITWAAGRWAQVERPMQLAVGMGQVGELGFVLTSLLLAAGLVPVTVYSAVLASVVISIAASTVAVRMRWTH